MKTTDILLDPNDKYIKYIQTSKHYLNDPKHMFNSDAHSIGRLQGEQALIDWLKGYQYPKPIQTAQYIMQNIVSVKYPEFNQINVNTYIDKTIIELPYLCQLTHDKFEREYESAKPIWGWNQWAVGIKFDTRVYRKL